jgi:hypothetical protein
VSEVSPPLLNHLRFQRAEVQILINGHPLDVLVEGLDYGDTTLASLYLSGEDERRLIGQLGSDPFRGSFEINVAYSTSTTGPLTEDRLVDCRIRGTGYSPMPLTVLFVRRGHRPSGRLS